MIRSAVRAAAHRPALRARLPSSVSVPQQQRAQRSILLQTAILSSSRALSTGPTPPVTTANAAPTATTTPAEAVNEKGQAGLPPPPPPKRKRAGFFKILGRVTAGVVVVSIGTFGYFIYEGRHPPDQLPADPTKKTIVVLGSGWGATSLLKGLDTEHYNVIVVSPHNYFLFTPLLPSVTVGTLDGRSIVQPTRHTTRFKRRAVQVYEAEAESIDVQNKTVTFEDKSEIKGHLGSITVPYDYLVYAVGSENQTFGIQGIREHACFLKELGDAVQIRTRLMDCIETASLRGQSPEEIERLLHMVVVGGGPTGIEYAAELRDFIESDLVKWYPEVANKVRVTLVEALPKILPMFSQTLIAYTEQTFKDRSINLLTQHMVKDVDAETITVQDPQKELVKIPYGLLVWAAGNTARPLTRSLMSQLASSQTNRRGLEVDDHMRLKGAEDSIFAIGDATATAFAPTAQAASQQGTYLARVFGQMARADALASKLEEAKAQGGEAESETKSIERQLAKAEKLRPFHYSHQGSLAYIGSDKAIADLPFMNGSFASGGVATFLFWRSAYFSMLFSLRNRTMVAADWLSVKLFGRDVSRE